MKKQYSNTNEKNFKFLTILIPFIADLYICSYLWKGFGNKEQFDKSLKLALDVIGQAGGQAVELPQEYIAQLWELMILTLVSILSVYLIVHVIVYLLYYFKEKKGALSYIKFYSLSAGILMPLFAVFDLKNLFNIGFLIIGIAFLWLNQGIKFYEKAKEKVKKPVK
ncbi:hypothetical protein [Bacteriovorax sp. Seq25_V]|uniref:hypothetical protein n=1 Tax=Bacteriovorax sp. Seq25_V TaxID=1201288 RepID=UPI000389E0AA|nr:hypothetical protein [Bacteriovorax sp. Seq25_V]EQC47130.1 hypothetical protein M900_0827 [Bacteriovorax sp. Seq25_V]